MFSLNDSMRYYLCPGATDMRKSFYTLGGLVTNVMKQDLRSGDVFIFLNRKKTTIKLLMRNTEDLSYILRNWKRVPLPSPDMMKPHDPFPCNGEIW